MAVRTRVTQHEYLRRAKGLGTVQLARMIGVSHPYVSNVEGRNYPASERYRDAVSKALSVPTDVLFDPEGWAR